MHIRSTSLDPSFNYSDTNNWNDDDLYASSSLAAAASIRHSRFRTDHAAVAAVISSPPDDPLTKLVDLTDGSSDSESAGAVVNGGHVGDITRPSLNRLLNGGTTSNISVEEESDDNDPVDYETVIIHEVKPTDSLAGIALKYGLSIYELRRTNHLWTNDSIFLRKILYIPFHNASSSTHEIRKVRKADLGSFFPPPTKQPSSQPGQLALVSGNGTTLPIQRSASSPSSSSSLATTISTTATSIISRLSFDSAERTLRGSTLLPTSSKSRKSSIPGHELVDVSPRPSLDGGLDRLAGTNRTYVHSHPRSATSWEQPQRTNFPPASQAPGVSPWPSPLHGSPPNSSTNPIRTAQLEPEPGMKVPPRLPLATPRPTTISSAGPQYPYSPNHISHRRGQSLTGSISPPLNFGGGKKRRPGLAPDGGFFEPPKMPLSPPLQLPNTHVRGDHDGIEMD